MKKRNTNNPPCRNCPESHVLKDGKKQGIQKYKCPSCGHMWLDGKESGVPGVKPLGKIAMTAAERQRKRYAKLKEKFKEQN